MENVEKDKEDIIEEEEDAFEVTNDGVLGAWLPYQAMTQEQLILLSINIQSIYLEFLYLKHITMYLFSKIMSDIRMD